MDNFDDPIGAPLNSAIMGINDNFELIGWHGTKNGTKDCVILLDDGNGGYDRTDISNAVGVNISNNNECVGNQAVGAGTGWVCGSVPGQDLPPLDPAPEGWVTDIGSGSIPHITGFSNNKPVLWKVISGVVQTPINLFGGTNWTGRATASADLTTGNEATMVGYRDDSGLSGYIWTPDGAGSWVGTQMTNLDMPFDVNNSDEAVGQGPGGQWDSRLYIADEDLTLDLRTLVQTWFSDENQVDSTEFEVTATNDSGTIAGTGKIVSDSSHVVCLLVPYDCNNNGTPDYREVLANGEDPLGNGDWLLDDCEMLRPGLQAPGAANPGNEARHVKYVNVVRFITSTGQIEDLLCDAVWSDPFNILHGDPRADLPQDTDDPPRTPFLQTAFATMNTLGYRTVCYGPFRQEGATPQRFWLGAMYASQLTGETSPDYSRFRQQFEDAAMQYSNALNPWLPHPNECGAACTDCQ